MELHRRSSNDQSSAPDGFLDQQGDLMKNFFKRIIDILDSINRARAASYFTRMGRYDLARAIMLKDENV